MFFAGPEEFRDWLVENHETADELWMGLNQKHVAERGLTWAEAVPEALCFGWIDSLSQRVDDDARRQRWTPRRPGSNWSAVNIALVEKLTAEGRMHPQDLRPSRPAGKTGAPSIRTRPARPNCRPSTPPAWPPIRWRLPGSLVPRSRTAAPPSAG